MGLQALGERLEVGERKLASDGAQKGVLLAHGLEEHAVHVGPEDGYADAQEPGSRSHVEEPERARGKQRDQGEGVREVPVQDLACAPRAGQIDAGIPGQQHGEVAREQLGTGCTERQPELRERLAQALAELGGRGRAFRAGTFHVERRA